MIIVSGWLEVAPDERDAYLAGCVEVMEAARAAEGCLAFHLSADPIEPTRINIFEQWTSLDAVEAFRGAGPADEQAIAVLAAEVFQHEVADTAVLWSQAAE